MADEKIIKDEKKLTSEEITDEQANEAAGGGGRGGVYQCCACRHTYYGSPFRVGGRSYCANCVPKVTIL